MTVGWARLDVRFWEKAEVQYPLIMCLLRCGKVRSANCAVPLTEPGETRRRQLGLGHALKHQNHVIFIISSF